MGLGLERVYPAWTLLAVLGRRMTKFWTLTWINVRCSFPGLLFNILSVFLPSPDELESGHA